MNIVRTTYIIHKYIHTYIIIHTHIHTYIHTYIHIYIHTAIPCGKDDQHIDHLIYECELLKPQRDALRFSVSKIDKWPTSKYNLISNHHKALKIFTNQIYDSLG